MSRPLASVRTAVGLLLGALLAGPSAGCHEPAKTLQAYPSELAGVGIVVKANGDAPVISKLFPGGPAADAGLREGDRIVAVDGVPTSGKALAAVVDSLRGSAGTDVAVSVDGGPSGRTIVHLTRRQLARSGGDYHAE